MIMRMNHDHPDENRPPDHLEIENQILAQISHQHNTTPDPQMGGMTPEQVFRLCFIPWGVKGSPIQCNAGIPLARLESGLFFRQARTFLCAVRDAGGVKATATKNLNRKFVGEMVEALLTEKERTDILGYFKVLDERMVFPLHLVRVVCKAAGLLRLAKGQFSVPQRKQVLLAPERAGELYRDLFLAYFMRFNLGYLMQYGPDARAIQEYAGYSLYRLGVVAGDWRPVDGVANEILLPGVREDVEAEIRDNDFYRVSYLLETRIIGPLIKWGLLEGRYEGVEGRNFKVLTAIRITPLYSEFLRFELT
jgi:hypothetical protein